MTTNHGLYTDTAWAVPVLFKDAAGAAVDMSGYAYVAELIAAGATAFSFKSTGGGASDGTIDTAQAATGTLTFNASSTQHAAVSAGLYRIHLKRDVADDVWTAEGTVVIGGPGANETYVRFDDPGTEASGAVSYARSAELAKIAAVAAQTGAEAAEDSATAQAVIAVEQATISTDNAAEASASATAAAAAQAAAIIGAGVYAAEATGRAAVADGVAFKVQGSGDAAAFEYRRVNSTTSTLIATYPSLAAVGTSLDVGFNKPLVNTGTTIGAQFTMVRNVPAPNDGYVTEISIGARADGVIKVSIITLNTGTGGVSAITASDDIEVVAGVATYPLNLAISAGQYIAVTGSNFAYQAFSNPEAKSVWFKSGSVLASGNTLTLNSQHRYEISLSFQTGIKARTTLLEQSAVSEDSLISSLNALSYGGFPEPLVATGTSVPTNYTVFPRTPVVEDGVLTSVTIGCGASGTMKIYVADINSSGVVTIVSTTTVSTVAGINTYSLNVAVAAGQFVGVGGGNYRYQPNSNPTGLLVWLKNGVPANGDTLTNSSSHRYEVRFSIGAPFRGAIVDLSGVPDVQTSGLSQLKSGDNTGVADATTVFANGGAQHPFPYVRPGSYALTSINKSGAGFWGPGKLTVDGGRFFIPPDPMTGNLLTGLRAALQEDISAANVVTLIGDSVSHFAFASTGAKHWFNMFTRFANYGIAKDEPVMTALRSSSTYTPAFYGVSTSGTITTGTRGPLAESAILAAGASISFTGSYEQIDVFYTQQSGAGSISFSYNGGAAYKTVSAAGTLTLDVYTGPSATTSNTSGTYTITATGGPVELTGLIRLAPKTAGTPPRLLTNRSAHGSYAFPSFTAATITSILKQGTFAGGKCVPIVALGINDSFGTAPSTIVTNATTVLDALAAGNVPRIFAIPPIRPSSAWDASYTGGRTFDGAAGPLRKLYRDRGVIVLPADNIWINQSLQQDGLHPNDDGNDAMAQTVIETISRRL